MDIKKAFEETMESTVNMALATSVDGNPNVRVVTFAYDKKYAGKLFFTTFGENQKVKDMAINPRVACIPLPENPASGVQVRIFGTAKESTISIGEVTSLITKKYPDGAATIKEGGEMMKVYEVDFSRVYVTIGVSEATELVL